MKKLLRIIAVFVLTVLLAGCSALNNPDVLNILEELTNEITQTEVPASQSTEPLLDENGWYYSKDDVSLYLQLYSSLPGNFMTKKEAQALGWSGGDLWKYADKKCIGGDKFGNREKLLPSDKKYIECDIDYNGGSRGAKRIVFADDYSFIYYTEDHYETFEQIYP